MHFRFYLIQDIHCPKLASDSSNAVISIQLLDYPISPRKKRKPGKFCDLALAKLISSTFPYKTDIECC